MVAIFIGSTVIVYSFIMKYVLENVSKPATIPTK